MVSLEVALIKKLKKHLKKGEIRLTYLIDDLAYLSFLSILIQFLSSGFHATHGSIRISSCINQATTMSQDGIRRCQ